MVHGADSICLLFIYLFILVLPGHLRRLFDGALEWPKLEGRVLALNSKMWSRGHDSRCMDVTDDVACNIKKNTW